MIEDDNTVFSPARKDPYAEALERIATSLEAIVTHLARQEASKVKPANTQHIAGVKPNFRAIKG